GAGQGAAARRDLRRDLRRARARPLHHRRPRSRGGGDCAMPGAARRHDADLPRPVARDGAGEGPALDPAARPESTAEVPLELAVVPGGAGTTRRACKSYRAPAAAAGAPRLIFRSPRRFRRWHLAFLTWTARRRHWWRLGSTTRSRSSCSWRPDSCWSWLSSARSAPCGSRATAWRWR